MKLQLGKRLWAPEPVFDENGEPKLDAKGKPVQTSEIEVLVVKPGSEEDTVITYNGMVLEVKTPEVLPSAD